jgi:hypothetical protein
MHFSCECVVAFIVVPHDVKEQLTTCYSLANPATRQPTQ